MLRGVQIRIGIMMDNNDDGDDEGVEMTNMADELFEDESDGD